jgi:hypothetical protein
MTDSDFPIADPENSDFMEMEMSFKDARKEGRNLCGIVGSDLNNDFYMPSLSNTLYILVILLSVVIALTSMNFAFVLL